MPSRGPGAGNSPHYFTIADIAERWRVSTKSVRREIASGVLVSHRFRGKIRVSAADLFAYERQRRQS